jgi:hypothetical protein
VVDGAVVDGAVLGAVLATGVVGGLVGGAVDGAAVVSGAVVPGTVVAALVGDGVVGTVGVDVSSSLQAIAPSAMRATTVPVVMCCRSRMATSSSSQSAPLSTDHATPARHMALSDRPAV